MSTSDSREDFSKTSAHNACYVPPEERALRVSELMEEDCSRSRCEDCERLVAQAIREAESAARKKAFEDVRTRLSEMRALSPQCNCRRCETLENVAADLGLLERTTR